MSYEPPIKITIAIPNAIEQGRGVTATGGPGGNLRIRCTVDEYILVQEEAAHLGISMANFSRCCIVRGARNLRQHREANSTDMEIEDIDNFTTGRP